MNEPTATPFSDDDLSAALDRELSAEQTDALARDVTAQARLEQLRIATQRVAAVAIEPLPAGQVDALVTAALDAPVAPVSAQAGGAPRRGPAPWLVAAAVIVLMAIGLGLLLSDGTSTDTASTGASSSGDGADQELDDSSAAEESAARTQTEALAGATDEPVATTTAAGLAVQSVGSYATGDELRTALATSFPEEAVPELEPAPAASTVDRCAEQLQITLNLDTGPSAIGFAEVAGEPVLVYEFATESFSDGSPTTLVAAVGAEACDQVVLFER